MAKKCGVQGEFSFLLLHARLQLANEPSHWETPESSSLCIFGGALLSSEKEIVRVPG